MIAVSIPFRLAVIAAALHLLVVSYVAAGLGLLPWRSLSRAVAIYGGYTGANMKYGFFAPNIGTQFRAFFDIVDKNGRREVDTLEKGVSSEAAIRLGNVVALYASTVDQEKVRRVVAASWAGKMFGRHPGAREVWVRIEAYELPPMARYRLGARAEWREIYRARFEPDPIQRVRYDPFSTR